MSPIITSTWIILGLSIILSVVAILLKPRDSTPTPQPTPQPKANLAKPVINNLINTLQTYCGIETNPDSTINHGPLWKRTKDGQCGTHSAASNQQDFWLSGNNVEILANYTQYHHDYTFAHKILDHVTTNPALLEQLLKGYNGTWNDDRLWWVLGLLRMYEINPPKYQDALKWAVQVVDNVLEGSFTEFTCGNQTYKSTWWQLDGNDPQGLNTYRNTVTNALLMEAIMRLYNIRKTFSHPLPILKELDDYYNIAVTLSKFLKWMQLPNGAFADGMNHAHGTSLDFKGCAVSALGPTYDQGIPMDAFARLYIAAQERGDQEMAQRSRLTFTRLMQFMLKTPQENKTTTQGCKLFLGQRQDCGAQGCPGNKPRNDCCFSSALPHEVGPFCFKKTNQTDNPLLAPVHGMNILSDGADNMGDNPSDRAFKGIFVRYLTYTIDTLERSGLLWSGENADLLTLVDRGIHFIRENADWVIPNAKITNGMYSFYWDWTREQNQHSPVVTTATTFSVVDLMNSQRRL